MDRRYFDESLGNSLYEARVLKRLTQEQLTENANKIWLKEFEPNRKNGCSRSVYVRYEKGEVSMPINFYKAACKALGIDWIETFRKAQDYELNMVTKQKKNKK